MESTRRIAISVATMAILSLTLFFIILSILAKWKVEEKGFTIDIKFNFLNDLSKRAPVKVAGGINIGYVLDVYQKDLETYVKAYIDEKYMNKIPKTAGTVFSIFTTGLMGQKYINVTIPIHKEGEPFLKEGDVLRGVDPPSIDQMMTSFSTWFDGQNGGQIIADIMKESQRFISNLNAIAAENRSDIREIIHQAKESFNNLSTQMNTLMAKLNILTTNFADITTKNKEDIQIMLQNIAKISNELNTISKRISIGKGSMGKFIFDEELYQNANQAMEHAKNLMQLLYNNPSCILKGQCK